MFNFDAQGLRVVGTSDEPWFVAADVVRALGLGGDRVSEAVAALEDDEKGSGIVATLGGPQQMLTVNESGLYCLIFRSRKEEARMFRKWVTAEVLPSLRRTGRYDGRPKPAYRLGGKGALGAHALQLPAEAPNLQAINLQVVHCTRLFVALLGEKPRVCVPWTTIHEVIEREQLFFWMRDDIVVSGQKLPYWRLRACYSRYLMRFWGLPVPIPGGTATMLPFGRNRHRVYTIERKEAAS